MADVQGRILIFAGAGASKAVRLDKFPTTKEFFDDLLPPITDDPLFKFVLSYIQSQENKDAIDIEQVLWELQSLREFFENVASPKNIVGYAIKRNLIGMLFSGQNYGHLTSHAIHIKTKLDEIIGLINQVVYELYSYEPTPPELENNWTRLILNLEGVGKRLDIFTTNYDVVIEAALNVINGEGTGRQWRGITGAVRQRLDLDYWSGAKAVEDGILTKLHGSLDWKLQNGEIHVGDPLFTGDHARHAIIYPGFKGSSRAPFFQAFHDYLAESIADSELLIFIGFAFRDEFINQIIRENLRANAKVFVLNPDKSVRFPARRAKVKYLPAGFDEKSIAVIVGPFIE